MARTILKDEEYWQVRNEEHANMRKQISDENSYKRRLESLYKSAQDEIIRDIEADIIKFADSEGLSIVEARRRISKTDVESFSSKVRRYVEERDFSPRANEELRLYNVTTRTNRLQLLESRIHLELVSLTNEEERMLQEWLSQETLKELTRQAGILGEGVPDLNQLQILAKQIVESERENINFSERIWQNQKELQAKLDNTIRRTILRGENPRVASRELRQLVSKEFFGKNGKGGAKYAADRIAITETARVQTMAQKESFRKYAIDQFVFIAESDACDDCLDFDGKIFNVDDSNAPTIPVHPFCRCSTAAYVDRKAFEDDLTSRGL